MSEAAVLVLVARYPHPGALARHLDHAHLFTTLLRLERHGLVRRRRGLYRLTGRGRRELETERRLARLVARALDT